MSGGELLATNSASDLQVGGQGVGQMTMSNGTVLVGHDMAVARALNSVGTLTVQGGTIEVARVSSSGTMAIGGAAGARGTFTMAGGVATTPVLVLGLFNCTATGTVVISGGSLYVTNAAHNAVLEVRNGTVELDSGTLVIDKLVITNACGHFIHAGGTVSITMTNVSPNLDADGDGIPNASDLDAFDPADAGNDPDGDGFTNLQEFQAGTNPTNSASFLGITAIATESNDIRVTWMTGPGKTNALERSAGAAGSFSNNFTGIFTVTNVVGATTNYLDVGAATNAPARFYRVRLVP